jgi:hypothetical protein
MPSRVMKDEGTVIKPLRAMAMRSFMREYDRFEQAYLREESGWIHSNVDETRYPKHGGMGSLLTNNLPRHPGSCRNA